MNFGPSWREVREAVRTWVKLPENAHALLRKSMVRLGGKSDQVLVGMPPGGTKDQHLAYDPAGSDSAGNVGRFFWQTNGWDTTGFRDADRAAQNDPNAITETLLGFTRYRTGTRVDPTHTPSNRLGIAPRRFINFSKLRNPAEAPVRPLIFTPPTPGADPEKVDNYFTHVQLSRPIQPISDHAAQQFLVWEDIPAGRYYYPLNLDLYNKKVDFSAANRVAPIEVYLEGCLAEGNPDAEFVVCYSTASRTGPWTELCTADLQWGGAFMGDPLTLPEAARADVWVTLMLRARSPVDFLHVMHVKGMAQFKYPHEFWQPYRPGWVQ